MTQSVTVVWIKRGFRLLENPLIEAALSQNTPVIPLYIHSPEPHIGEASQWWLHHSLKAFDTQLQGIGSKLTVAQGDALDALQTLARQYTVKSIITDARIEAEWANDTQRVETWCQANHIGFHTLNSSLLLNPTGIQTKTGGHYKVFTPFYRFVKPFVQINQLLQPPTSLPAPDHWPDLFSVEALNLLPSISWDTGFYEAWQPGEAGALAVLDRFILEAISDYGEGRNRPDKLSTSRLSPYLHFGDISPKTIWFRISQNPAIAESIAEPYLRQLVWREFAHHTLAFDPTFPTLPQKSEYNHFPWQDNAALLKAWQKGQTGYPIVDAGMRELWATGWMHNRVRMIVASFLIKDLLIPWQRGAEWFWDTLVDADCANNSLGWQWTAGCGPDAAPFFRVFNPMLQGVKFDPEGIYVRQWVPELADLPNKWIHNPFEAPADVLSNANVKLGTTYPQPLVDHKAARNKALQAYETLPKATASI